MRSLCPLLFKTTATLLSHKTWGDPVIAPKTIIAGIYSILAFSAVLGMPYALTRVKIYLTRKCKLNGLKH